MVVWIEEDGILFYTPSIQIDPKRAQKKQNQQHTSAKENERHIN